MQMQKLDLNGFASDMQEFERLCECLYSPASSSITKTQADQALKQFTDDPLNLGKLKFILDNSQSIYAQFLAASSLKQLFSAHWTKIPVQEKLQIKDYILNFLVQKGTQCDNQVLKMIIMLLAKITKMSWFDHPELQSIVSDISQLFTMGEKHIQIALQAINDLIIEMSYVHKVKNLTVNRRISLNFRDSSLFQIFKQCVQFTHNFADQITTLEQQQTMGQATPFMICENLLQTLNIYEKALSFDFTAILLNETMDDPSSTNIPTYWRPFIEDPNTLKDLFRILRLNIRNEQSTKIKMKACNCLSHLANTRHTIFETAENRIAYVTLFASELIQLLQSQTLHQQILKDRQIYKEFVPIVLKLQSNFQVRDLVKAGDAVLEGYLAELMNFTLNSYKTPSASIKYHASKLNYLWQRVLFESSALKVSCQSRLEEIVLQVISTFLDEQLNQKALSDSQLASQRADSDGEEDDEDENFDRDQRTARHDDLDFFSKLMRQKIEQSLLLILDRLNQLIQAYELSLSQNQLKSIKTAEKQIAFIVRVVNSLFSYGLPSSTLKTHLLLKKKSASSIDDMGVVNNDADIQEDAPKEPQFIDFQIISRILYVCKITNQLHQSGQRTNIFTELELALLAFSLSFKNHVLTDSRLVLLGSALCEDQDDSVSIEGIDSIYNESKGAYAALASLAGEQSMQDILQVFAQKLVQNLMVSAKGSSNDHRRIVDQSLDVLSAYLMNSVSCRQLASLPDIRALASAHISQFNILADIKQQKQLGQFFRVLTGLWLTEDYIEDFHEYLNQLNTSLEQVFSLDTNTLKTTPGAKEEVTKLFYILRGILRGCHTSKSFNLFFDWFYPTYLSVMVEGSLNAFHDDDDVVIVILKFLTEMVNNRNNRVRFDTWNINGLIVFKETSKYVTQLLQLWDYFNGKQVKSDAYKETFKYIKVLSTLYHNMISGNYINFAICEYYNDDVFTTISKSIFAAVTSQDVDQLRLYEKVHRTVFTMTWHFFNHHMELLFLKFDLPLTEKLIQLLVKGLRDPLFDIQADSTNCINTFNEFVYEKLKSKPTQKSAQIANNVQQFYQSCGQVFQSFLRQIIFTLLFEDNKNIWIFQKCLHSSLVLCSFQESTQQVLIEVISENEKNEVRKNRILTELQSLMQNAPTHSIDTKSRETFTGKFNAFKAFIQELPSL